MNVTIFWESSLWIVDEVTLLSNKNLKETLDKNKLELSKLLEEFTLLYFSAGDSGLSKAYNQSSSDQKFLPQNLPFSSRLNYL